MNEESDVLKNFFKEMREADAKLPAPPFTKPQAQQRQLSYILIAVAASLNIILFLGAVWQTLGPEEMPPATGVNAAPAEDTTDELMKWETPTDQLLSKF